MMLVSVTLLFFSRFGPLVTGVVKCDRISTEQIEGLCTIINHSASTYLTSNGTHPNATAFA
jgi:hypothetical protein